MDSELRVYLNAVLVLLSLIAGLLATVVVVSAPAITIEFFVIVTLFVGGIALWLAVAVVRRGPRASLRR